MTEKDSNLKTWERPFLLLIIYLCVMFGYFLRGHVLPVTFFKLLIKISGVRLCLQGVAGLPGA